VSIVINETSSHVSLSGATSVSLSVVPQAVPQAQAQTGVLVLSPTQVTNVAGLANGRVVNHEDIGPAIKDGTRGKLLSISRHHMSAQRDGAAKNIFLKFDNILSNRNSFKTQQQACLVGASISYAEPTTAASSVMIKDNAGSTLHQIDVPQGTLSISANDLNATVSASTAVSVFIDSVEYVNSPMVDLEFAWQG
tara:strand:+ start:132 stop:713 length:582 start_codon:yes stop_codon:yes gene_type:complete